ncbi:MAG: DUF1643 domain-containing protein [Patescibacteria group bacterium]
MKWIYTKVSDNSARFTLGIEGKKQMLCFGINPSTAAPNNLDNTVKSVERIANRHKFDGWIMLNIYPQRATYPDDLHVEFDKKLHQENMDSIEKLVKSRGGKIKILAAWGTLITKREYLKNCLRDIHLLLEKYKCEWVCIGKKSKDGHPHHPLYLKNSERVRPFNMKRYIKSL